MNKMLVPSAVNTATPMLDLATATLGRSIFIYIDSEKVWGCLGLRVSAKASATPPPSST